MWQKLIKSANKICKEKKKEKNKAQTEVIEQQKEIENLKATSMQLDPKNDRSHDAGHCLYV